MKKNFVILSFCLIAFSVSNPSIANMSEGDISSGSSCTSEEIDCPGWNTGNRTICHINGHGVECTCGDSTTCE